MDSGDVTAKRIERRQRREDWRLGRHFSLVVDDRGYLEVSGVKDVSGEEYSWERLGRRAEKLVAQVPELC